MAALRGWDDRGRSSKTPFRDANVIRSSRTSVQSLNLCWLLLPLQVDCA